MQEHDAWQERYLSLVPEKLTAADVQLLSTSGTRTPTACTERSKPSWSRAPKARRTKAVPNRPGRTREVAYMLTPEVERALVRVLHEVEPERGRRVTWDFAFRRLLEMASRPVEREDN